MDLFDPEGDNARVASEASDKIRRIGLFASDPVQDELPVALYRVTTAQAPVTGALPRLTKEFEGSTKTRRVGEQESAVTASDARLRRYTRSMARRPGCDDELFIHFVTFSCFKRRRFLSPDRAKRIVIGSLGSELRKVHGKCPGFVMMPDHVHALVWFPETGRLNAFMRDWKRGSSRTLNRLYRDLFRSYRKHLSDGDPIWQDGYDNYEVYSQKKLNEKLEYMHANPVRAGLVEREADWRYSSARFYQRGESVGIPIDWPEEF